MSAIGRQHHSLPLFSKSSFACESNLSPHGAMMFGTALAVFIELVSKLGRLAQLEIRGAGVEGWKNRVLPSCSLLLRPARDQPFAPANLGAFSLFAVPQSPRLLPPITKERESSLCIYRASAKDAIYQFLVSHGSYI